MPRYDYAVVGGGIVGLATAMALVERFPHKRLLLLEKETELGRHQTGHNSGVIHSGIYYTPGSLKARLCRQGNQSMVEFCEKHEIEHEVCGKVIVATEPDELPRLERLSERGTANGLEVRRLDRGALREIEPHARGLAALQVPSTGIVSYRKVAEAFARVIRHRGGRIRLGERLVGLHARESSTVLETTGGAYEAAFLVNCAGLYSDRVARFDRVQAGLKIAPFRGEYYDVKPERRYLVRNLIYPVPNPRFPFLGVHFTRMIDGTVHAGPNAVLGLGREAYRKGDLNLSELAELVAYPGFWRFALANLREGLREQLRSWNKAAFVKSLQRLVPDIQSEDLTPSRAGVRAQALMSDGRLMDDFVIARGARSAHVCNAPSPAATASIEIGREIVARVCS